MAAWMQQHADLHIAHPPCAFGDKRILNSACLFQVAVDCIICFAKFSERVADHTVFAGQFALHVDDPRGGVDARAQFIRMDRFRQKIIRPRI